MSANVETMMYVREKPWHGLGTMVAEAPNSAEAMRLAGLDWQVTQHDVFVDGQKIEGYKANVRSTDNTFLGIVSDHYKIVQNVDAFAFTDAIVGETENGIVTYETAGSLNSGKRIWLLAKMPTEKVLGDEVEPYMCFTNSHDGTGAIRVCMTPIRVVCNNTLNMALNGAKNQWSTKHIGDVSYKMEEAKYCLGLANHYMKRLDEEADRWANTTLYMEQLEEILNIFFPVKEDDSNRKKANVQKLKDEFYTCYFMPDIAQYRDTAWGAINAMSDAVGHNSPQRKTSSYNENRWGKIMTLHPVFDQWVKLIDQKVGASAK